MNGVRFAWEAGSGVMPGRVLSDAGRYYATPERATGGQIAVLGDRGITPQPLIVEVEVQGDTWQGTRSEAQAVLAAARRVSDGDVIETPRGLRTLRALQHSELSVGRDGVSIHVRLIFLPAGGAYS